jgi:hypothetical protein
LKIPQVVNCYIYGLRGSNGATAGAAVAGETEDAAGLVGEGAVTDAIVVLGGAAGDGVATVAWLNILDIKLVNIP